MTAGTRTSIVIPARPPARLGTRLLTAGILGVVTGSINHGLLEAGERVLLNERINVPPTCNLCGTNAATTHRDFRQDVTFSDLGALLGGSLLGQANVEFQVPLCEGCDNLPDAPGVSLASYGKRGDRWEVTLLVANATVASLYLQANPGSVGSEAVAAPRVADGPRTARAVYVGAAWAVAVDGVPGKRYDEILKGSLVLSPDGRHVAYAAKAKRRWMVVVDGVEGRPYDGILNLAPIVRFSPDSRRTAYGALTGSTPTVVIDGTEHSAYEGVAGSLVFSPDSRRVGYVARSEGLWRPVVDGTPGTGYDDVRVSSMAFSPDGDRLAFCARIGDHWTVVVDGVEGPPFEGLAADPIAFSPDGRRVAFAARTGDRWTVVIDGTKHGGYDGLGQDSIAFSPDGERVAFVSETGGSWTVVLDGVEGNRYAGILAFRPMVLFSGDSRRVAYGARLDGHTVTVVVDGVEQARCQAIRVGSLAFSPDLGHVAYQAQVHGQRDGEWTAFVDGAAQAVRPAAVPA